MIAQAVSAQLPAVPELDLGTPGEKVLVNETVKTDGTQYYIINAETGQFLNDENGVDDEATVLWTVTSQRSGLTTVNVIKSAGGKYINLASTNTGSTFRPNWVYSASTSATSSATVSALTSENSNAYYSIGNKATLAPQTCYLTIDEEGAVVYSNSKTSGESHWLFISKAQYDFEPDFDALIPALKAAHPKVMTAGFKAGEYNPLADNGVIAAYNEGLKLYKEYYKYIAEGTAQDRIDAAAAALSPSAIEAWQQNATDVPAIENGFFGPNNPTSEALPLDKNTLFRLEFDYHEAGTVVAKAGNTAISETFSYNGEGHAVFYIATTNAATYTLTFTGSDVINVLLIPSSIESVYTAQQVEDGTKYFIYNVATDRFVTESGLDTEEFPICYTAEYDNGSLLSASGYKFVAKEGFLNGNANGVTPLSGDAKTFGLSQSATIDGAYSLSYSASLRSYSPTASLVDNKILAKQIATSPYAQWYLVSETEFYANYPGAAQLAIDNFNEALARLKKLFYRSEDAEGLISNVPTALANSTSKTIKEADQIVEAQYPYSPLYIFEYAEKINNLCEELPVLSDFYLSCKQDIANAEKMSSGATLRTATTLAKGELELCSTTTGMSVVMSAMRVAVVGYMQTIRDFADNQDFTGLLANPSFETGDMTGWLGIDLISSLSNLTGMIGGDGQLLDIAGLLNMIGFGESSQPQKSGATDGKYAFDTAYDFKVLGLNLYTLGQQAGQVVLGLPQGLYRVSADMQSKKVDLLETSQVGITTASISLKKLLGTAIDMVDIELIKKVVDVISQVAGGSEDGVAPDYVGLIGEIFQMIQDKGLSITDIVTINSSDFKAHNSMTEVSCEFETDGTDIVLIMACAKSASVNFIEKIIEGVVGSSTQAEGDGGLDIAGLIQQLGPVGEMLTAVAPYRADNFHLTHLESHKPDYLAKLAVTSALAALGTQYGMVKSQTLDKEEDVDDRHKDYEYFQDEMAKTLVANDEETAIKQRIDALADEVENTPIYKFNEIVKEGILGDILKLSLELDKFYAEYVPANAAIKRFIANYNNVEDHYYEVREATIYNEDYDEDYYAYSTPKSGDAYQDVVAALAKVLGNPDDGSLLEDDYESIWERLEEIRIDYVRKTEPRVYAVNLPLYLSRLANIDACLRIFQNGFFATLDDYKAALDGVAESKTRYDEEVAADNEMTETNQAIFMSDLDEEGETLVTTYARDIEDIKNSLLKKDATPVIATETSNDAPAYNLNGVLINKNAKGIIIRDGKKILVK